MITLWRTQAPETARGQAAPGSAGCPNDGGVQHATDRQPANS